MGSVTLFVFSITAVVIHTNAYDTTTAGTTTISPGGQQTTSSGAKRVLKPPGCIPKRPPGYAWNSEAGLGVWYGYMYRPSPPVTFFTNAVEHDRGIGWQLDSGKQTWVQSVHLTVRETFEPYLCRSVYLYKNFSCNGFARTKAYVGGIGFDGFGQMNDFVHLYMEPSFVYIRVNCFDPGADVFTVEHCEMPGISVWTRKKPIDITPLEDVLIRDIFNDRLASYCVTADDMLYMQYFDNLPPCPFIGQTENIRQERNHAQEYLVEKCFNPETDGRCVPTSYY